MPQIKVLRIISRLNIGGPAIHTVLLTAGLNKPRFESLLVCGAVSRQEGDMSHYAAEKQARVVYIPQLRRELNLLNDLIAFIKIFRIIKKEKPDIIHTHTAKAGTLGRLAGIVRGSSRIKLIHTFHGHIFESYFNKSLSRIFVLIEKFLACFTFKVITVSDSVKDSLIALGICRQEKIQVIPLGLELDKFLDAPASIRGCELNVGIVGRLAPIKNHRLFLEAADRLKRSFVNVSEGEPFKLKFIIVGDGELRSELEEYARKLNLSQYVEFSGWRRDLVKVYADLDIVCLSSLNEGTPVSLIEAMACSKPIVATEVGGVVDLLGEKMETGDWPRGDFIVRKRGLTVKSNDADGFARAIRFMLENEELREKISNAGREYAKDTFAIKRLISDIEELYLKALKICQL